uniref:KH domain-containing protein n=1 Tax=Ascaris suum TaxID=6253 RepID=F1KXC9_ASCSU
MKRSVVLLAGGLAVATVFAWFIRRRRAKEAARRQSTNHNFQSHIKLEASMNKRDERGKIMWRADGLIPRSDGRKNYRKKETERREELRKESGNDGPPSHKSDEMEVPTHNVTVCMDQNENTVAVAGDSLYVQPQRAADPHGHAHLSLICNEQSVNDTRASPQPRVQLESEDNEQTVSCSHNFEPSICSESVIMDQNENTVNPSLVMRPRDTEVLHEREDRTESHDEVGFMELQNNMNLRKCLFSSVDVTLEGQKECEMYHIYEFEVPNTLVGLLIGVRGKTIKELSVRNEVVISIRPHHISSKMETHQIYSVEGGRDNINKCMRMLRRRFPADRFPDLNLQPVLPPPIPLPAHYDAKPTQLMLPEGVRCEVVVCSIVDAGHFFVQQPTHPSFESLHRLNFYMLAVYNTAIGIPELPRPCGPGLLCAAPANCGWYRAVTISYYEEHDEVLIRFIDYGGYSRLPRCDLRQIRTDFMSLPFQATECYTAHVEPADGSLCWSDAATNIFGTLTTGRTVEAFVVGYSAEDFTPFVELFCKDGRNMVVRVDRVLLEAGLAKLADPSKLVHVQAKRLHSRLDAAPLKSSHFDAADVQS